MYKNIEILDKKKHQQIKFNSTDPYEVAKNIGIVPIGVDEILDMCPMTPVIISAGENNEFVAFTGLSNEINIYKKESWYVPKFLKTYPFLNIVVRDNDGKLNTIVAVDMDEEYVGENKSNPIIDEKQELSEVAAKKIELVRDLNKYRDISKKIVQELQQKELLEKKDFRVTINGEEKIILDEFYIVNREKLLKLDDETLALWAKKGWIGIIDAHIKSLNNFQKILVTE